MTEVNAENKMSVGDMIATAVYVKTFGLVSMNGCVHRSPEGEDTATVGDSTLITDEHPLNTILSTDTLNGLANSSAAWGTGVNDFLAKANSTLTSSEANASGNFTTSVIKLGDTVSTDDGYSEVTISIMIPGNEDASAVSALSAAQLYQNGDVNVDLAQAAGYTGSYVMVAVVKGYTEDGELTGVSSNMMSRQVTENPSGDTGGTGAGETTNVETELHTYYVASAETLVVDLFGTDLEYTHDDIEGVAVDDDQIVAHTALYDTVETVTTETVSVPSTIAQ